MADYPTLRLVIELLLIESGLQKDEDTSAQVEKRIENQLSTLRQQCDHLELNVAEEWMLLLSENPFEFGQAANGQRYLPEMTNEVLRKIRNNIKEMSND